MIDNIKELRQRLQQGGCPDDEECAALAAAVLAFLGEDGTRVLAEAVGVSKPSIQRWTCGKSRPHQIMTPGILRIMDRAIEEHISK